MSALVGQSQGATGALQATQAGNQLLALQAQQLADLTASVAANGRAQALIRGRARGRGRTGPRAAPPLPDAGHRLPARQRPDVRTAATEGAAMDGKMLARLGAVVFVAVAITATAIEMTRKEEAEAWPRRHPIARSVARRTPLPIRCAKGRAPVPAAGPRPQPLAPGCLAPGTRSRRDRFLGRSDQPRRPAAPINAEGR
jgi:hypothetical protein